MKESKKPQGKLEPGGPPGEPVSPCTEAPAVRYRDPKAQAHQPQPESEGYTSRGHVEHFLPDREVNLAKLNKALADVYGEPAFRVTNLVVEIDKDYWDQVCADPWKGNLYSYSFRPPSEGFAERVRDIVKRSRGGGGGR